MIAGTGIDIVENLRIQSLLEKYSDSFLKKMMTEEEIASMGSPITIQHLAGVFAAKEAVVKALGTAGVDLVPLSDISIIYSENGAPVVLLAGKTLEKAGIFYIHISISHETHYSVAVAIAELR